MNNKTKVQPAQSPLDSALEKLRDNTSKVVHLEPREAAAVLADYNGLKDALIECMFERNELAVLGDVVGGES